MSSIEAGGGKRRLPSGTNAVVAMNMKLVAIGVAAVVLALDLLSKWWVKNTGWLHYHRVIDGFFTIHYVRNEGIAFGLFHDHPSAWKPAILAVLAVAAAAMVLYYIWTSPAGERGVQLLLGLLLGGILGNFCDRLWRGYVVDFLEFHWQDRFAWPTFNLADAAITCGVAAILYQGFLRSRKARTRHRAAPAGENPAPWEPFCWRFPSRRPCWENRLPPRRRRSWNGLKSGTSESKVFPPNFRQVFQSQGIQFESDWGEGILLMKLSRKDVLGVPAAHPEAVRRRRQTDIPSTSPVRIK